MADDDSDAGGHDPRAFAQAWLREQRRLWASLRAQSGTSAFFHARREWENACDTWRAAVLDTAPASLRPAISASLDHSQLFIRMAMEAADQDAAADPLTAFLNPERFFEAAATAVAGADTAADTAPDEAQLRALAAAVELLARIAQSSLQRIRTRLVDEQPATMAESLQIYIDELEANYLEAAASDEFARVAGDLVNTWVEAEARARDDAR